MYNFKIRLVASFNSKIYHFATLEFKTRSRELIYIFEYFDKRNIVKFYDFEINKSRIQKSIDHVSFHKDGNIHIRYKNIKNKGKKLDPIKIKKNPFELTPKEYRILLLNSFYFSKDLPSIYRQIDDISDSDILFEVNSKGKFSVTVFSLGSADYKSLLETSQLRGIFNKDKTRLIFEPFLDHSEEDIVRIQNKVSLDTCILLACSDKTPFLSPKLIDYENLKGNEILETSSFTLLPTENKLKSLE